MSVVSYSRVSGHGAAGFMERNRSDAGWPDAGHDGKHCNARAEFVSAPACYDPKSRAPVAQLDRATGFEPVGRRFESCRAHF